MLGKLLKYEIKATARTFLPLYLAILLAAVGVRFVLAAGSFRWLPYWDLCCSGCL